MTPAKTSFPKDKIRIVLAEGVHEAGAQRLIAAGFDVVTLAGALTGDALAQAAAEAHVLGIRSKTQIDEGTLDGAGRLLAVGCFCAGTNQVDLEGAAARGVPVFNAPFSNTRSVAEMTISEVIALHRRMFDRSGKMHAGVWDKSSAGSHEVRGKTLGIVGYGHIGSQVSVLAEAMGMVVVYYDVEAKLPLGNARACGSLGELLERADVVTLHVPATPTTKGMIGAREIGRMKPGAMLINNARGSVVDVDALAAAVKTGRLGGAAVDVFPEEPARAGESFTSPLQGLSNVILTPHVGGSTIEAQAAISEEVAGKLIRFINEGTTLGAVNVPQVDLPDQGEAARGVLPEDRRPHRILHFHRNVPGVLSKLHAVISSLGANVTGEHLRTTSEIGYVVLDVDPTDAAPLLEGIRKIPETIRTRVLW
ncbi:MAG: phosphoglycerate dehydrogenase [Phycisphaerales bacterium]